MCSLKRGRPGVSDALVCLMDLPASFAALAGQNIPVGDAPDSIDVLPALLGDTKAGRDKLVEHDGESMLGFRDRLWKFIEPDRRRKAKYSREGELYDLGRDLGETNNLSPAQPETSRKLSGELDAAAEGGRANR